ncbi:MAG: hypothetical protein KY468_11145, partial [Armatimonadetes bacterium]|nr:hypothetical protein [Armatimonadota bacterium]
NYGDIVRLVDTPEDYVAAVRQTLNEDNTDRIQRGLEEANKKTWDVIVAQMEALVEEAEAKPGAPRLTPSSTTGTSRGTRRDPPRQTR